MNNIKIGIIGAGFIVEMTHLPAIRILPGVTTAWIFDKSKDRMNKVAAMYNIPALTNKSIEEAIPEADVCLLAVPYGVRKTYIELCRQHGKALVVEKPFAFTVQEHRDHCHQFQDWQIGVNFQRRFYYSVGMLHKIIRTGTFGKLQSVHFKQGNFVLKGGSGYLSDAALAGGGVIAESAVHNLDIILFITGAQQVTLNNMRSFHRDGLDYDSLFESTISNGQHTIPVFCEITTLRNLPNELELQFADAKVVWDLSPFGKIKVYNGALNYNITEELQYEDLDLRATRVNEAFLIYWQQFIEGLRNKAANQTSASNSVLTTGWLESIYKKIRLS